MIDYSSLTSHGNDASIFMEEAHRFNQQAHSKQNQSEESMIEWPQETNKSFVGTITAWCVLDKSNSNKGFGHFPHTLQFVSLCWSFFMREQRQRQDELNCGIKWKTRGLFT